MFVTVANQEKRDTSIFVDGIRFVRVHFINCELIYRAREEVDFQDCTFERCSWTFDDSAVKTLGLLATLYGKNGTAGQQLVEGIFTSIRSSRLAEIIAEANTAEFAEPLGLAKSA